MVLEIAIEIIKDKEDKKSPKGLFLFALIPSVKFYIIKNANLKRYETYESHVVNINRANTIFKRVQ